MEKEKLSSDLRGLVGENSLSERTWNEYIENIAMPFLPTEEDKLGDYLSKHANALKSMNGQLNFEVANKVSDFKKNYNPEPQNPQNKNEIPPSNQHLDDDLKRELDEFRQFKQSIETERREKALKVKRDSLLEDAKTLAKTQGAVDDVVMKYAIKTVSFTENDSKEVVAQAIKKAYDEAYSELNGRGYQPAGFPNSASGNTNGFKAYKEQKQREGKLPVKN